MVIWETSPTSGRLICCYRLGVIVKSERFFGTLAEACMKLDRLNSRAASTDTWEFEKTKGDVLVTNGQ